MYPRACGARDSRVFSCESEPVSPGCGTPSPDAGCGRVAGLGEPQERLTARRVCRPWHPGRLLHVLSHSRWGAGCLRDDLQTYAADRLGTQGRELITDDTGFIHQEGHHLTRRAVSGGIRGSVIVGMSDDLERKQLPVTSTSTRSTTCTSPVICGFKLAEAPGPASGRRGPT